MSKGGERGFLSEVKLPGREFDHLRPPSTELKDTWSYTSSPL
jgi:hypothetical protein